MSEKEEQQQTDLEHKKRPGLLKGSLSFVNLILMILVIRWIVFEIFLIPSGSMYPKLFVNDYIVVSKIDFGLRVPFTQKWAYGPKVPDRRAVTVFKDPDDSKYLIKRLVGLPRDQLEILGDFIVSVNGEGVVHKIIIGEEKTDLAESMEREESSFTAFKEIFPGVKEEDAHVILTYADASSPVSLSDEDFSQKVESFEVPPDYLLFMGDNRNKSYDGRRFGYVEAARLVGRARFIALSCRKNIVMNLGCNITSLRSDRLGKGLAY